MEPSSSRPGRAVRGAVAATLLLALLQACTVTRPIRKDEAPPELPALTAADILAPVDGSGDRELQRLGRLPDSPSVTLRASYIRLSTGNHTRALKDLNRLLFGKPSPSAQVESFARYLRSLAYEKKGDHERAEFDRNEAATLAQDPGLRRRIEDERARHRTAPVASNAQPLRVLPRSAWGAAAANSRRMVRMSRIDRITIHHSAMYADDTAQSRSGAIVRSIQKTHQKAKGWGDIGYHYLIDRDGRVWTGREDRWQGAHAGDSSSNRGNLGICLLGNFVSRGGQAPSSTQLVALNNLVQQLCRRHGIGPQGILTHREIKATECPGGRLQVAVDRMRRSMLVGEEE